MKLYTWLWPIAGFFALFGVTEACFGQSNTFPASGNVGIGTTTPSTLLEVMGDVTAHADSGGQAVRAIARSADNFTWAPLAFTNDGVGYLGGMAYTPSATIIFVGNGGSSMSEIMRWLPNGNVGVGQSAPSQRLAVANSMSITNSAGAQYLLMGNQDSGGTNRPAIIRSYNANFEIGYGNSWSDAVGGTFANSIHVDANGNVGIDTPATETPPYPLSVNGTIEAKEVIVQSGWSDYVFGKHYKLEPLSQVEHTIETEHHLPGMPTAKDIAKRGVSLGGMQAKLLAQVEELTLHVIQQQKQLEAQARRIDQIERENRALRNQLAK